MKNILTQYLAVGVAGFVGAITRMGVGSAFARVFPTPVGTMAINLSGSFVLGWFFGWAGAKTDVSETMRLAVAVGFLGSYTTFSTLMHDSNRMIGDGAGIGGMANLVLSFVLGLAAVKWGVYWAGR